MAITVHIHKTHRQFTDGLAEIEVSGSTVGETFKELVARYPDMEKQLFDKKGKLSNIVEVYLNGESAYPNELAKRVKDGDQIHVTFMLAGG
ncbi:MAG: MoaD/ThiS family protein [Deltaproteobacteria bacterium]|nr:MoaD/ThiS family protein [Deltaproteobacteria bacterium]